MKTCFGRRGLAIVMCCAVVASAQEENVVAHPEIAAGPWEVAGDSGIDGIFVSISGHAPAPSETSITSSQRTKVRVYHRKSDRESGGWYADVGGDRLRFKTIRGTDIDLTFDSDRQRWVGTWAPDDRPRSVVLERPKPARNVPNPVVGNWEGIQDSGGIARAVTRLHISEGGASAASAVRLNSGGCC